MNSKNIEKMAEALLHEIEGCQPLRRGIEDTPTRVAAMYKELFMGYYIDPKAVMSTTFTSETDGIVVVRDIEFYSHCEHHMVPFYGHVSIGYVPGQRMVGISKFARLVEVYSRRLQVQERMTTQIADTIMECLQPAGCIVICNAVHLCMKMRGVKNATSSTSTSCLRGVFMNEGPRQEFFKLCGI
ncbi:MAG: GTP cyclohydrolase I FolE [Termitinemataceae bacterium]|nr:MAG: GTP cyclohydrolase I FolE [Termitinemataceae bacterium]